MLSKIINIAFESLACGGFWIADSGWTYALWPHRFGSARDCMASFNLAEISLALKAKRPGLRRVRAEIAGREVLIVAASLVQLGERIEHVIGQPVGKLLPAEPPEVKTAWRRLAMRLHPDRGGDHQSFTRAKAAYERLMG
ncbi:J domain-containing protein [Methylococcus sp. ANG]|uniref:J domain-containing protein n=1 Tax=Methylococcus sp. ANG TaxID=3231903 RepID=UPI00345B0A66